MTPFETAHDIHDKALEACSPDNMSVSEAIEFYEELISLLEGSLEALKEENDID